MVRIPTHKLKLSKEQKQRYKELKSRRKYILKKYEPFSPTSPSYSPLSMLYDLYSEMKDTAPDVLYYHATRLYRKAPSDSTVGNICIGLISGVVAGFISSDVIPSFLDILSSLPIVQLILLPLFIVFLFGISYFCVWEAHFILPFFLPDCLAEKELEIISSLLDLDQYFSIHPYDSSASSADPTPVPASDPEIPAPPESSLSSEDTAPAGTSRPC